MNQQTTEQVTNTVAAHRSLGRMAAAIDKYALFSLDPTGAVQNWNVGAQRVNGYTESEIIGEHFSVFYLPEDRRAGVPEQELSQATTQGHWSGDGWRVRKDGERYWANVFITAALTHSGALDGFIVKTSRDETERQLAENHRRDLESLLERQRIALELSDATIRGIFSAALAMDSALAINTNPQVADRIRNARSALDRALEHVRDTVTGLRHST